MSKILELSKIFESMGLETKVRDFLTIKDHYFPPSMDYVINASEVEKILDDFIFEFQKECGDRICFGDTEPFWVEVTYEKRPIFCITDKVKRSCGTIRIEALRDFCQLSPDSRMYTVVGTEEGKEAIEEVIECMIEIANKIRRRNPWKKN